MPSRITQLDCGRFRFFEFQKSKLTNFLRISNHQILAKLCGISGTKCSIFLFPARFSSCIHCLEVQYHERSDLCGFLKVKISYPGINQIKNEILLAGGLRTRTPKKMLCDILLGNPGQCRNARDFQVRPSTKNFFDTPPSFIFTQICNLSRSFSNSLKKSLLATSPS